MREQEAYKIMFRFLDERYSKLPSDQLGTLLGELQLAADGEPFDAAIVAEWNQAVASVQQEKRPILVEPQRRAS